MACLGARGCFERALSPRERVVCLPSEQAWEAGQRMRNRINGTAGSRGDTQIVQGFCGEGTFVEVPGNSGSRESCFMVV